LDNTAIPADRTRWGSFDELRQRTDADALAILKDGYKPNLQIKYRSRKSDQFIQVDFRHRWS
jgi:predicted metalloendopeptidase